MKAAAWIVAFLALAVEAAFLLAATACVAIANCLARLTREKT